MKKYKPKLVKFVFTPKQYSGSEWSTPQPVDYHFGNKHSDKLSEYTYNRNHISLLFSDELRDDVRQYDKKAKFTENEAYILLLKYVEDRLKLARKEKRRLDRVELSIKNSPALPEHIAWSNHGYNYARTVNNRELKHNTQAVKVYRKKVKEILASKEYIWEQLLK